MSLPGRRFLNLSDLSLVKVDQLINLALSIKRGEIKPDLRGKIMATVFFNPSVRTRTSFAAGMFKMGGTTIDLSPGQSAWSFEFADNVVMNGSTVEHVKEVAPVLSQYVDVIGIRSSELITNAPISAEVDSWETVKQDTVLNGFAKYATVPVINMESNVYHPCQGLGDAITIREKLGSTSGKKYVLTWAYHPKALPMATPNSQLLAACDLGMEVVLAHPEGWELDPEIIEIGRQRTEAQGGSLTISHDMDEAVEGAHIVCAKSWGASRYYGDWESEADERDHLHHWIVTMDKMRKTNNGYFMHCLPVRRNVVVTDGVLDSDHSIVVQQAGNRMWAQMAVLAWLLGAA
jgi:N-acetylornithine carbamoyltransferase